MRKASYGRDGAALWLGGYPQWLSMSPTDAATEYERAHPQGGRRGNRFHDPRGADSSAGSPDGERNHPGRWRGLSTRTRTMAWPGCRTARTRCFQVVEQKRYGRACGFGLFSRCLPSLLQCLVKLHGDGKASGVGETLVLTIVSVWASCGLLRRSGRLLLPARAGSTSVA